MSEPDNTPRHAGPDFLAPEPMTPDPPLTAPGGWLDAPPPSFPPPFGSLTAFPPPGTVQAFPPPVQALPTTVPATAPTLERPHPLTPVAKSWIAIAALVFWFGRDFLEGGLRGMSVVDMIAQGGVVIVILVGAGALGFFQWRYTRFVIDDTEVRIERNFINHTSDKIPFSKIQSVDVVQPFVARLMGLAALQIDVGSGAGKRIEFLQRARCYKLRDYLLARAGGENASMAEVASRPQAGAMSDLASTDEILVRATPVQLIIAAVTSLEFLLTTVPLLIALGVAAFGFQEWAPMFALVPLGLAVATFLSRRVIKNWNYTLARTGRGLRVSRGATSLVSRSLPTNRIQGVAVSQGPLWRPLDLHRVEMTVLGSGNPLEEDNSDNQGTLVPAGSRRDVDVALDAIWPGFKLDELPLRPIPARARTFRWFDAKTYFWGHDDEVVVARGGLIERQTTIVHHARAQSVRISQGPLQRRVGLASVAVHTTQGPAQLVARHLDATDARVFAMGELDRMRAARARGVVPKEVVTVWPTTTTPPAFVPYDLGHDDSSRD